MGVLEGALARSADRAGRDPLARAAAPILSALRRAAAVARSAKVRRALEHLHDHLLDADGRAWQEAVQLTQGETSTLFYGELGVLPTTYLRDVQMLLAVSLLLQTDLTLSEIADVSGFSESSSLIRRFVAWAGQTPQALRDRVQRGLPAGTGIVLELLSPLLLHQVATLAGPARAAEKIFDLLITRVVTYLGTGRASINGAMEKNLAAELWERHLATNPTALAIDLCRRFFRTRALNRQLSEVGLSAGDGSAS